MRRVYNHSSLWLAATGVALILSAFFWYEDIRQTIASYSFTPGTVVDFEQSLLSEDTILKPVIHFLSHKGEMVELILPNNNKGLAEGESVEVMYPASDPFSGDVYSEYIIWGGPALILFTGIILLLFVLIMYVMTRQNTIEKSLQDDSEASEIIEKPQATPLHTLFVNVEKNRGAAVNGRLPYCIYSQWRDPITSEIHFFQSKNLWLDPTEYIRKKVTVYIEQDDLQQYNVDLSFLPKEIVMENSRLSRQYANKSL